VYGGLMVDYSIESIHSQPVTVDGKPMVESTIVVQKLGGTAGTVPIEMHLSDGSTVVRMWDGQDAQVQLKVQEKAPVEWAAIDPHHTLVLENRHINNFLKTTVDTKWSVRWNLGLTKLIEIVLNGVAW
jgi:hypothetical protein